nr:hypothetical protein [uncultured Acetatifactor sp.]
MERDKKYFFSILLGLSLMSFFLIRLQQNCINNWKRQANKNRGLFLLMNQWVNLKQDGKKVEGYFIQKNLKRIAIYGMGYVGKRLVKELKRSEIDVVYGIDRNAAAIFSEIELVTMDDDLEDVDAVVVTLVDEYDTVCEMLSHKVKCSVIAIEDIINEV